MGLPPPLITSHVSLFTNHFCGCHFFRRYSSRASSRKPTDTEQIDGGAPKKYSEIVFSDAGSAWAMIDWEFSDGIAGRFRQGRHKGIKRLHRNKRIAYFPMEAF